MSAPASRESFRVRGENAPVWLPSGLALLGLGASMVTALLLLQNWYVAPTPAPTGIGTGGGKTHAPPPIAGGESGEMLQASDFAEEKKAMIEPEGDRAPAVSEAMLKPSSDTRIDADSTTDSTVRSKAPASPESSSWTADPAGEQASTEIGGAGTTEQTESVRGTQETAIEADSGRTADASLADCAPVFSVGFLHGSIEPIDKDINRKIKRLAHWLSTHPRAVIFSDGHADSSGPEEVNLVISYRRAAAIADLLSRAGVPEAQTVIRAYGEGASLLQSTESEPVRRVTLRTESGISCNQRKSENGGAQ